MKRLWSRQAAGTINDKCGLSITDGMVSYFYNDCGFDRIEIPGGSISANATFEASTIHVKNSITDPVLLFLGSPRQGASNSEYPKQVLYSRVTLSMEHTFETPIGKRLATSVQCGEHILFSCRLEKCYTDYPFSVRCYDESGKQLWEAEVKTSCGIIGIDENRFLAYTKDGSSLAVYSAVDGAFLYDLEPLDNGKDVSHCVSHGGYIYVTKRNALRIYDDNGPAPVPLTDIIDYDNYTILPKRVVPNGDSVFIVSSGSVFQYSLDGKERLMEFSYATEGRERKGMNAVQGGVCVVGNVVCFGSSNHNLWCFNRHTGDLVARVEYKDFVSATPVFDGDKHLVVACYDGTVECFDVSDWL